jgi:hypothetical protein
MKRLMQVGVAGWVALLVGCSSPCSRLDDAEHNCGDTFDRTKCDANINSCTSDDIKLLNAYSDCVEVSTTCKDGATKDGLAKLGCLLPLGHVSSSCKVN